MQSNKGNYIANQFVLTDSDNGLEYFQSYNSIIAKRKQGHYTILDVYYWNYSRTTSKYRSIFLGENTDETKRKIKEGIYKLENLN